MKRDARKISRPIVALFLIISIRLVAWTEITVYPLSIKVPLAAGEKTTFGFWIENVGNGVADVRITLHDWWRTPEGKLKILPPGTLEGSCAPWITYAPSSVLVPPGEKAQVAVRIEVPEDAVGDRWALFLVAEYPSETENAGEGMGTRVVVAYAVKILRQDPVNAEPAGEIRSVEVARLEPLELRILYVNTGNAHTVNTGTVIIKDIFGETVGEYLIEEFPALPGEERVIVFRTPPEEQLPEGIYYALVTIDFGGEYMVQGGVMFQISHSVSDSNNG